LFNRQPLSLNHYITATCAIDEGVVYQNGQNLFENKNSDLRAFLFSAFQHFELNYPKFHKMDMLSKLGWLASEILLKAGFEAVNYQAEEICIVFMNSNSSLDTDIKYWQSTQSIASPALFVYTLPNVVMGEICIKNKFKGENAFFVSDQFDAALIHQYVSSLLAVNAAQVCICGWVEVIQESYKAVLMLVEKKNTGTQIDFTIDNITQIFNENGRFNT
jgi:hypothetical protein